MILYVGDRVLVHAAWSSFHGMRGRVTQTRPHLMVHLDGDSFAMRFGDSEVRREESARPMVAGE